MPKSPTTEESNYLRAKTAEPSVAYAYSIIRDIRSFALLISFTTIYIIFSILFVIYIYILFFFSRVETMRHKGKKKIYATFVYILYILYVYRVYRRTPHASFSRALKSQRASGSSAAKEKRWVYE